MAKLATVYDVPDLARRAHRALDQQSAESIVSPPTAGLRTLQWCKDLPDPPAPTPPVEHFFGGSDWWVARNDPSDPDGLAVAAKGGHNAEEHNHNDCGSFVVHHNGESILGELGKASYFQGYFFDQRYDSLGARSLGHPVPYVNETEQASSIYPVSEGEYRAEVIERDTEDHTSVFELELSGCYPETSGLAELRRRFTFERGTPGSLEVSDEATFEEADGNTFESIFVSYHPIEPTDAGARVTGDRTAATIAFDGPEISTAVEHLPDAIKGRDVWRLRAAPRVSDQSTSITAVVVPEA